MQLFLLFMLANRFIIYHIIAKKKFSLNIIHWIMDNSSDHGYHMKNPSVTENVNDSLPLFL